MSIVIERSDFFSVNDRSVEIVERKGLGHPDTLADALAEEYSVTLSRFYLENFGRVLHHNVDKALLVGGRTKPAFGGGEVEKPIIFYLVGRATEEHEGLKIPVEDLYKESAKKWLRENIRNLDPNAHILFKLIVRPGSPDLINLFDRKTGIPLSNDTSFGVGFAPLTETERLVLLTENFLNSKDFKDSHPEVGEDIKVMAIRRNQSLSLTVSIAFVGKFLKDARDYLEKKERVRRNLLEFLSKKSNLELQIDLNTADDEKNNSFYITVTGTSAEGGDDGQVGRGNRVNGLITPMRPMSLEAVAGKNPISHVGKLYNILSRDMAEEIVKSVDEVEECCVFTVSQIGKPITDPQIVKISVKTRNRELSSSTTREIEKIAREKIDSLPETWLRIVDRSLPIY